MTGCRLSVLDSSLLIQNYFVMYFWNATSLLNFYEFFNLLFYKSLLFCHIFLYNYNAKVLIVYQCAGEAGSLTGAAVQNLFRQGDFHAG
jgi:hypothetical protein